MIGNALGPGGKFFLRLLFQKPLIFKMDRKIKMNTNPVEVQLLQSISIQPGICYRREDVDSGCLSSCKIFLCYTSP